MISTFKSNQKIINLTESHFNEIVLELENAADIILNQKNEIEALENVLGINKDEIETLHESERQMKKEKKKLIMENQKISTTLKNEIETLKMELQHTRNQVEIWKGRTNESKASLRKFLESTIMEKVGDSSISGGTGGCLESYENTIMSLKNQLDERQLRIEQLEMNMQTAEQEKTDLSNELCSLKSKNKTNEYELRELREKYRKEENEKKRLCMREEKLSQEIDSLCKKYNLEIDDLQKKNMQLNDEIWELKREIKSNKMSIKELEDQNNKNKKYYECYSSFKNMEDYIYNEISNFESYVSIQLAALNELTQKVKSKKTSKKIKSSADNNINERTKNIDIKSDTNYIYNNSINNENMDSINFIPNIESSISTEVNSSFCSSKNNSNPPFINNTTGKNNNINSMTQPSIGIIEESYNSEKKDNKNLFSNVEYSETNNNHSSNNKYLEMMKETMNLISKANNEHHTLLDKIKLLSKELDEIENCEYKEKGKSEHYLNNINDDFNNSENNNGCYSYYICHKNEQEKIKGIEDDARSESSIISFLSEM
ncbi:hypothetical protein FG386_002262 [Cryptosporidium ryanae]|uniref:uncharacterized protein n=1 Tax=Cryptosporidium ryanae TaxID=515981 RepID=UPI00351A30AB|nr:hypothetical protein FG386_002262 [Cryptosporidium ryanae]